jgi:hypothetical protein
VKKLGEGRANCVILQCRFKLQCDPSRKSRVRLMGVALRRWQRLKNRHQSAFLRKTFVAATARTVIKTMKVESALMSGVMPRLTLE